MLGFVLAQIPWNAISNLELWRAYTALRSKLVLPSASTLRNSCWRKYTLTVDAIKKQLRSRNKVGLAFEGWTFTKKFAIMSIMVYYMNGNWMLREVQMAFNEVDRAFIPDFERSLWITCQGSIYRGKASWTVEGSSWSFWADRRLFSSNYNR